MQITFITLSLLIQILIFSFFLETQSATANVLYQEKSQGMSYQVEILAERLGVRWGMVFIEPNKMLFTERSGKIGILSISSREFSYIDGGPEVQAYGQGGLLDVAVPSG